MPRKGFGSADGDTIIYLSLCTRSADPNTLYKTQLEIIISINISQYMLMQKYSECVIKVMPLRSDV